MASTGAILPSLALQYDRKTTTTKTNYLLMCAIIRSCLPRRAGLARRIADGVGDGDGVGGNLPVLLLIYANSRVRVHASKRRRHHPSLCAYGVEEAHRQAKRSAQEVIYNINVVHLLRRLINNKPERHRGLSGSERDLRQTHELWHVMPRYAGHPDSGYIIFHASQAEKPPAVGLDRTALCSVTGKRVRTFDLRFLLLMCHLAVLLASVVALHTYARAHAIV